MAMDWDAYFDGGSPVAAKSPDKIDWDQYFSLPNQEPGEPQVSSPPPRAPQHPPGFVPAAGTAYQRRQEPYPGMPLEQAWASDPISQGLDTAMNNSDVQAGLLAVGMHPEALGGAREAVAGVKTLGQLGEAKPPLSTDTRMPRASVRDQDELISTGGARMEGAKQNPAKVDAEHIGAPMQEFRDKTKTVGIETPLVSNIAKRLEKAYETPKPKAMAPMTKLPAKERPPVTLTELHAHQQRLDNFINGEGKTEGRINSKGFEAIELKKAVDKIVDSHPDSGSFKIGKSEVHRGKMSQTMDDLRKRAEGRRQWANGDEAGALQAEISAFLRNKKNRYALTPQVRHKLGLLSRDNKGKLIGAFGATNIGGFTFARGVESMFGMPGIMALPGHVARQGRNARLVKEFEKLMEEIRAGGQVR